MNPLSIGSIAAALVATTIIQAAPAKPNIIYILADDLAQGDVGCYGQKLIQTPRLDQMAKEGTRYNQCYSGTSVCAPSRTALMTGLDMGHSPVRGNREIAKGEGQFPLPANTVTVASLLKDSGYATACAGKWGMGMFGTTGDPLKNGFDHFYGYNCQRHAHNYFTNYLYDDAKQFDVAPHTYSPELIQKDVLAWVRSKKSQPFFLFYPTNLPHSKYEIDDLGIYKDKPWTDQQKIYAAMVTRLDTQIGELIDLLKELGIDKNTLVIVTGDNGSSFAPSTPVGKLFDQARGLRGFKRSMYEGGLRQPAIACWPGTIPAGRVSDEPWAFWDFLPTVAELAGTKVPSTVATTGHSLVEFLKGGPAPQREYFYWELHEGRPNQAIRFGDYKAVKPNPRAAIELYNLKTDVAEANNIADEFPDLVSKAEKIMQAARVDDPNWPMEMTDSSTQKKPAKKNKANK